MRSQVKATPSALDRIDALALTDGMAWTPSGWTYRAMLAEPVPTDAELEAAAAKTEARPSSLCHRHYRNHWLVM